MIAVRYTYGAINLWHPGDSTLNRTFSEPGAWVVAVAFTPNGQALVSTTETGVIQLCALPSGNLLHSFKVLAKAIAVSLDGQTLASGSSGPETSIKLWNLRSGTLIRLLPRH